MPPDALTAPVPKLSGTSSSASAMSASAALTCDLSAGGRPRLSRIRSEGQLVLRPTHAKGFEPWAHQQPSVARVSLSAGTAGPLGGDRLHLEVFVEDGAALVLNEISATLALPGTTGEPSVQSFNVQVGEGASLIWLPEPLIAARGCDHRQEIRVQLADSARFYLHEALIVGRHAETPGSIAQRVRVAREESVIYDQQLRLGPRYPGWDTPTVASDARCVGSTLVVDPGNTIGIDPAAQRMRSAVIDGSTVVMGIASDVVQISTVGQDNLAVAGSTREGLTLIGGPWAPP